MKILLTGANGYIGMRILPLLVQQGHQVVCVVRNPSRLSIDADLKSRIEIITVDFLNTPKESRFPKDIDAAYYLIHSMNASTIDFDEKEEQAALNFNLHLKHTQCKQVIYLGGIANQNDLSKHLKSRKNVEHVLKQSKVPVTALRAAIIVGSGSASFEIIRDLCEKLPVMITPKWVKTKCQPIAIRNVIQYLTGVLGHQKCIGQEFDIGGPNILSYKQMMLAYAKVRKLKLFILDVPIMTPKLSSYWLYFVTSTSYKLALNLVDSMRIEVISNDQRLQQILNIDLISYTQAIELAFERIRQNQVVSSWKDSLVSGRFRKELNPYIKVPEYGCVKDKKSIKITNPEAVLENIWTIGGAKGWYYGNFLWKFRGYLDKLVGGVGLRRGRTHANKLFPGDALDFWRVLLADREAKRLLLFAEMRVPGEAWLEFEIDTNNTLHQTATFRPKGLFGRLYWYAMLPFHYFIFSGMIRNIAKSKTP